MNMTLNVMYRRFDARSTARPQEDGPVARSLEDVHHRAGLAADLAACRHDLGDSTMTILRLAAVGLLALVLAACGGTTTTTAPDGGTAAPEPTAAPPESAPPVDGASPDASAIVLPSFDPSAILENLEGIDSYKISMSTDGEVGYSAVVVTKPELARDITFGAGDDAQHIVVIGDQAWMGSDGGFQPVPGEMAGGLLAAFDPILLAGGFATPGAWSGAEDLGTEERNGVQAKHFHIDSETFSGTLRRDAGRRIHRCLDRRGGWLSSSPSRSSTRTTRASSSM